MKQYILVSVRGWPDKSDDTMTRLIFETDRVDRRKASDIMGCLGGLFYVEQRLINEDELPKRSYDEIAEAHKILKVCADGVQ